MESVFHKINLDLSLKNSGETVRCYSSDIASRFINAEFRYGVKAFSLTGVKSAILRAEKPSGAVIFNDCEIKEDCVIAPITTALSEEAGIIKAQITLTDLEEKVISSPIFYIEILKGVYSDEEVLGTNEFSALLSAISKANEIKYSEPKHIVTHKTTEAVDKIIISKDKNGENLNLSGQLTIYLEIPVAEAASNVSIRFNNEVAGMILNGKGTTKRNSRCSFIWNGVTWENYSLSSTNNASNTQVSSIVRYNSPPIVNEIALLTTGGFPEGMVVYVYGRRNQVENNG